MLSIVLSEMLWLLSLCVQIDFYTDLVTDEGLHWQAVLRDGK